MSEEVDHMEPGYEQPLYILAFDHRGSFQKKWFGLEGDPTPEETELISDAKRLIFEGLVEALDRGAQPEVAGALVDEQFGGDVPQAAKERGLKLAMPVEKSGQKEFDFEYGEQFGEHIEAFPTDFTKVLVRYNPEGDEEVNRRQRDRLKRLSDWLREHDRKFLFELLVPAEEHQLQSVDGDEDRYDNELRPGLMRRAIADLQDAGIEVDIWKIEGLSERSDCEAIVEQCRSGGRDRVACVVLGRGADDEQVEQWLTQGAPVEGYIGFAIGRSIWGDALKGFIDGSLEREEAAARIAEKYLSFLRVYEESQQLSIR
jgi:5-dehydro-2-deoxygluconokinase